MPEAEASAGDHAGESGEPVRTVQPGRNPANALHDGHSGGEDMEPAFGKAGPGNLM